MYDGGILITGKDADNFLELVQAVFLSAEDYINKKKGRVRLEI